MHQFGIAIEEEWWGDKSQYILLWACAWSAIHFEAPQVTSHEQQ